MQDSITAYDGWPYVGGGGGSGMPTPDPTAGPAPTSGADLPIIGSVQANPAQGGVYVGINGVNQNDLAYGVGLDHSFVTVYNADGSYNTYEAGNLPDGSLGSISYGDSGLTANAAIQLDPPPGVSQDQWNAAVSNVFTSLANAVDGSGISYNVFGTDCVGYTAYGLQQLGYTPDQVNGIMSSAGLSWSANVMPFPDVFEYSNPLAGVDLGSGQPGYTVMQ